ncbi:MAG: Macrolide export ATP-binding/permease protein MacB [bacterium]|nr:Macrolide export ATP-binding/permease protein MacB [bacterium]
MQKAQAQSWEKIRGQIYEAIREALMTIRGNKMRSFLVILGVMIGVASLMGMVATLSGLEKFIASTLSDEGTPYLSLLKADVFAGEGHEELEKRKNFSVEDAFALATLPHVRGVMILYARGTVVKYKERKSQLIQLLGSNQPFLHVQNMNIVEGRFFTEFEEDHRRNVVAIGDKAAQSLFPNEDPIGKRIRINGKEYEVVGVFGKRKTIFGGLADNFMAVPYTSFERDFLWWKQGPDLHIIVNREEDLDETRENVRAVMRMRRKVPLSQPDDFSLTTAEAQIEFTKKLTDKVALALVVLASIALMVGGIGVMVIMLVSVTERTAEIGIRKAIGATRGQITWQFIIEAATLSGVGGMIGIFVGLGVALIPSILIGFPYTMPVGWVLIAVLMSLSVGLFFGIFPARRAAKLDPIVALRQE